MAISARDELAHAVSLLSESEAEKALALLSPVLGCECPYCSTACTTSGTAINGMRPKDNAPGCEFCNPAPVPSDADGAPITDWDSLVFAIGRMTPEQRKQPVRISPMPLIEPPHSDNWHAHAHSIQVAAFPTLAFDEVVRYPDHDSDDETPPPAKRGLSRKQYDNRPTCCAFCDATTTIGEAAEAGWEPYFWVPELNLEISDSVCLDCKAAHLLYNEEKGDCETIAPLNRPVYTVTFTGPRTDHFHHLKPPTPEYVAMLASCRPGFTITESVTPAKQS